MIAKIDINNFFDPDDYREFIRSPVMIGNAVMASNGYVCVTMPINSDHPEWPVNSNSLLEDIFNMMTTEYDFLPMPTDIIFPDQIDCAVCSGSGFFSVKNCDECDGNGELDIDSDYNTYTVYCKSCSGDGDIIQKGGTEKCASCTGTGKVYDKESGIMVFGVKVAPKYLKLIFDVPGIEVFGDAYERRLFFRQGEIRGLIMGMLL